MRRFVLVCEKGVSEQAKRQAIESIKENFKNSCLPVAGQLPLTEHTVTVLIEINRYLLWLSDFLRIPVIGPIRAEQIHLLPEEVFLSIASHPAPSPAFARDDAVYCNSASVKKPTALLNILTHEIFHTVSFRSYYLNRGGKVAEVRIGYEIGVVRRKISYLPFRGLNEAVTEQSVLEMFQQFQEVLLGLGASAGELIGTPAYVNSRRILNCIIKGVAALRKESEESAWRRFQRGMFTGQILHLRDIAKAFDRRSYRMAALWGNPRSNLDFPKVNELVLDYFLTEDEIRKEEIEKNLGL